MIAARVLLIVAIIGGIGLTASSAQAQTICPTTAIANGNPADATLVTSWFSCKAPTDNPSFTGSVGIGLTSPQTVLDVNGGLRLNQVNGGNGAASLIELSGRRSGWDYGINWNIYYDGSWKYRNSDYGAAIGLGDGTNQGDLIFTTSPYGIGGSNAVFNERARITNSGNVGIGTSTPAQNLEVAGQVQIDTLASASSTNLCISATTNGVLATCSSSIRYKENIRDAAFGLDEIMAMRPVTFKWKGRDEHDFGLIAEEVAKINPLFVTYKNGKIEGVKYPQLVAVLVGAVKAQQSQIASLKAANDNFKAEQIKAQARQAAEFSMLARQIAILQQRIRVQTAQR